MRLTHQRQPPQTASKTSETPALESRAVDGDKSSVLYVHCICQHCTIRHHLGQVSIRTFIHLTVESGTRTVHPTAVMLRAVARAFVVPALLILTHIPFAYPAGKVTCLPIYPLPLASDCDLIVGELDKEWRNPKLNQPRHYSIDVKEDNATHGILPRHYFLKPYGPKPTIVNCDFYVGIVDPGVSRGDTFTLRALTIGSGRILEWCFPQQLNGKSYPGIEESVYVVARYIKYRAEDEVPNKDEIGDGSSGVILVDEPIAPYDQLDQVDQVLVETS